MNQNDIDKKQAKIEAIFSDLQRYNRILKTIDEHKPKCAGCSNPDNERLTEVRATEHGTYHLCPVCKRSESED